MPRVQIGGFWHKATRLGEPGVRTHVRTRAVSWQTSEECQTLSVEARLVPFEGPPTTSNSVVRLCDGAPRCHRSVPVSFMHGSRGQSVDRLSREKMTSEPAPEGSTQPGSAGPLVDFKGFDEPRIRSVEIP